MFKSNEQNLEIVGSSPTREQLAIFFASVFTRTEYSVYFHVRLGKITPIFDSPDANSVIVYSISTITITMNNILHINSSVSAQFLHPIHINHHYHIH